MDYFVKVVFPKKQEKQTKPLAKTKMMLNFASQSQMPISDVGF